MQWFYMGNTTTDVVSARFNGRRAKVARAGGAKEGRREAAAQGESPTSASKEDSPALLNDASRWFSGPGGASDAVATLAPRRSPSVFGAGPGACARAGAAACGNSAALRRARCASAEPKLWLSPYAKLRFRLN